MRKSKMICCSCGRQIEMNSVFCNWCGESQIKQKRKANVVTVPKAVQLPSGVWRIQLRREKMSFTDADPDVCRQMALAYRIKWQKDEAAGLHVPPPKKVTLADAIDLYLASKSNILSPSTLRGYKTIREFRFQECMNWDVHYPDYNWQMAINNELADVAPKTVKNAWGLISSSLRFVKAPQPSVSLPRCPRASRYWLDYQQIGVFLSAIRGESCELACLLALHSLRLSELLALQPSNILLDEKKLVISGSRVLNSDGQLVYKELNKTDASQRTVRIIIPRLLQLLKRIDKNSEWVVDEREKRLYDQVNRICSKAGLPPVGIHGLRHSFASLAYHLGWKELSTMQMGGFFNDTATTEIYTHNADLESDVQSMVSYYDDLDASHE